MPKKLNTEFFIARRLSGRSSRDSRNVMVRIAAVTVAISIAVMIIAVAVISGFRNVLTEKISGFGGHVLVLNLEGNNSLEPSPIYRNPELEKAIRRVKGFKDMNAYATKGGIVKTDDATQGIMLKGVGSDYDWSFFGSHLKEGTLPQIIDSARTKDIIISASLSRILKAGIGDQVSVMFFQSERSPRPDRFKITGIYDTGFEEMDLTVIPTDIRNVQRLNSWDEDQITGYEINTTDFRRVSRFADDIYEAMFGIPSPGGEILITADIPERFPNLFDWLKAHNVNAAVIIIIMLAVALLSMSSALLIILLERTRMIGVLKALGMDNRALQKTFVMRSGFIIVKGMIWGNITGIGLCLIQKYTHAVKLDASGYLLSEVPVNLGAGWITVMNLASLAFLLILLTIPTSMVSRITPDSAIRYQ